MSCVIVSTASPDAKPSNTKANARFKLQRLETTIAQSIEVALQLKDVAQSIRARDPRHHAHWEHAVNHTSLRDPTASARPSTDDSVHVWARVHYAEPAQQLESGNAHARRPHFDVAFTATPPSVLGLNLNAKIKPSETSQ